MIYSEVMVSVGESRADLSLLHFTRLFSNTTGWMWLNWTDDLVWELWLDLSIDYTLVSL